MEKNITITRVDIKESETITKNKKIRSSNFELLRIFAIFMIIIFHIVYHCVNFQLTDTASIARMNNGLFCNPVWYKKLLILELAIPLGVIGNGIFMLISGYFLVEKNGGTEGIYKTAKRLISQLLFATLILLVFSALYHHFNRNVFTNLIDIQSFNNMSWYIGYYFLTIVIADLFLNKYLNKFSKQQYFTLLITLFAIISFSWTRGLLEIIGGGLATLCTGVFLYS